MRRDVTATAQLWWLVPGRDDAFLEIIGGELESRGKVSYSCSVSSAFTHEHGGFFLAYKDNTGLFKMQLGFHHNGDESRIRTHHLSEVSPGIYRDESYYVMAVVLSSSNGMELSISSQAGLQHELHQLQERIDPLNDARLLFKHVFSWYHPGRAHQYVLVTSDLKIIYVSDKEISSLGEPQGHALYCMSDREYWNIHFHHQGGEFLHKVKPTLLARLLHPTVSDPVHMLYRATGTVVSVDELGDIPRCNSQLEILPAYRMCGWHIFMRQLR